MTDTILAISIVIPSLLILIAYSIKGLFIDDYNPYDKLKDINCFDSLRNNNGSGIKRFLAAIKYEQFKKRLLLIVDGRNLILAFGLYFIGTVAILLNTAAFSNISTIKALIAILPNIVAVILIIVSVQIKCLKKRIGD